MEQRRFGTSGFRVSVLSFGTMTIGGRDRFGKMGNLGIATIDTADVYSFGGAEEILSEAVKGRRDEFVLVAKGSTGTVAALSPDHLGTRAGPPVGSRPGQPQRGMRV